MNLFANIKNIYFAGIGGIGMSALARYFLAGNFKVAGYDRTKSSLTSLLEQEGCQISYEDDPESIPGAFRDINDTLVVYTPAINEGNLIIRYFKEAGFNIYKRAYILGVISENSRTIAIAGTHGKTTVTTIVAHLLKQSSQDCTAFLGGISKNYNSNLLIGSGNNIVVEADEFDRSFYNLKPELALVTAMDPDHLEVYGNHANMIEAYNRFITGINPGGKLVVYSKVRTMVNLPAGVSMLTYGENSADDYSIHSRIDGDDGSVFSVKTPDGVIEDLRWITAGPLNLQNALGAIALAHIAGVSPDEIRKALFHFKGVVRRFDVRFCNNRLVYIDDYAHHPEELNFLIDSVLKRYGKRKITAVFQPHLFTRTRDHAGSFAASLDRLDRVLLLPVYAAREEPIEGVDSGLIMSEMKSAEKMIVCRDELLEKLWDSDTEIYLTIGAGDIDRMVEPIVKILKSKVL